MHTYLIYSLNLLLPDPGKGSLWNDIAGMTLFSKGIMVFKYFKTRKIHSQTDKFLHEFRKRKGIDDFRGESRRFGLTPFIGMLETAYAEIKGIVQRRAYSSNPSSKTHVTDDELDLVADAIDRAGAEEVATLDTGIIFLATTANAAPFLGLLGTVIGIYVAFKDIGVRGTATLAVVAPAIAEALIATAAGLAVAIPALIGYNYFVSRNRLMSDRIDNFKSELFSAFKKELETVEKV